MATVDPTLAALIELLEREAQRKVQQLDAWRGRAHLRAELWARAYAAEFTGLRTDGAVRDHQDADQARLVARIIADAVTKDFDDYCREQLP